MPFDFPSEQAFSFAGIPSQVQAALWKAIRESSGETSSGASYEELIKQRLATNKVLRNLAAQSRGEAPEP
jgi:hypothetical protein